MAPFTPQFIEFLSLLPPLKDSRKVLKLAVVVSQSNYRSMNCGVVLAKHLHINYDIYRHLLGEYFNFLPTLAPQSGCINKAWTLQRVSYYYLRL